MRRIFLFSRAVPVLIHTQICRSTLRYCVIRGSFRTFVFDLELYDRRAVWTCISFGCLNDMNTTMGRVSSPMPTKRLLCQSSPLSSGSPDGRLYLRSDCFGLGSFISPCDLQADVGDLIQIDRVLYTDWALHVGNGNVVHVSGVDQDNNEIPSDTAAVRLSCLTDVAGISGVRVNNKSVGAKERGLEPLPIDEVIQNCYSYLDKEVLFNMLTRNSEHYVTEWKYGTGWSDQAAVTMSVMKSLSADCTGHNALVSGLNAVLNSPGSPAGRSTPSFSSSPVNEDVH